jgi:hypothetical protein
LLVLRLTRGELRGESDAKNTIPAEGMFPLVHMLGKLLCPQRMLSGKALDQWPLSLSTPAYRKD